MSFQIGDVIEINPDGLFCKTRDEGDPIPGDIGFIMEVGSNRAGDFVGFAFPGRRRYAGYSGENAFISHRKRFWRFWAYKIARARAEEMWHYCRISEDGPKWVDRVTKYDGIKLISLEVKTNNDKRLVKYFTRFDVARIWLDKAGEEWETDGEVTTGDKIREEPETDRYQTKITVFAKEVTR